MLPNYQYIYPRARLTTLNGASRMPIASSIPGTTALPNDGYMSIATIKKLAKEKTSSLKNASALSLLAAARKTADSGVKKEDSGELQDAYQQYCQAIK